LSAFFIKNSEVIPNFTHLRVESGSFDDVFKSISVVSSIVVKDGKGCPINSFTWVFECGLLEIFKSFFGVFKAHEASSENVERISLSFILFVCFSHEFDGSVNVAL